MHISTTPIDTIRFVQGEEVTVTRRKNKNGHYRAVWVNCPADLKNYVSNALVSKHRITPGIVRHCIDELNLEYQKAKQDECK